MPKPIYSGAFLRGGRVEPWGPPVSFACVWNGARVEEREGTLRAGTSVIDTGSQVIDAAPATLFGRSGLLAVQRGMQLRFYEPPDQGASPRWPYREIYSFYTASEQGGLLLHDFDGDGLAEIFCGNYWLKAPPHFDQPWRLFAINLFHEDPLSASARLLWHDGRLLWLESKRPRARAVWFRPGDDPRQLWIAEPVRLPLDYPRGVALHEGEIYIGDAHGVTRLRDGQRIAAGRVVELLSTPSGLAVVSPTSIRTIRP